MKINFIFLFVFTLKAYFSNAQRLGIKPFVGANIQSTSIINHDNLLFTKTNGAQINTTMGLIVSYQLTPKIGVEIGFINKPTVLDFTIYNPSTKKNAGSITIGNRQMRYQINGSYVFYNPNKWIRLKAIGGLELYSKIDPIVGYVTEPFIIDTNIVDVNFLYAKSTHSYLPPSGNRLLSGITLGIGGELMLKKKVVAELRFVTKYDFYPSGAYAFNYEINGKNYSNEIVAKQFSFNATLLINLSTLLGSKWKDDSAK